MHPHPVVKHIVARKNHEYPFSDAQNIALVNFGGFMTGINSAGAMLALLEMGLGKAFDSIYSVSSGFSNSSSFLSGDGKKNISVYYEDLCSSNLFNIKRFWKMINLDYLVDILKYKKPINIEHLFQQKTKLYLRLYDLELKKDAYVELHDFNKNDFFKLIRAASSAPFLAPGSVQIESKKYKDPFGTPSQTVLHIKHALKSDATDILIIYNEYSQYKYAKSSILNFENKRLFHIYPKPGSILDRFEMRPDELKKSALEIAQLTKSIFGSTDQIALFESNT